jgi:hypothetical protein
MAAGTKPIFVAALNNKGQTWVNADGAGAVKDVFVAGANGSRAASLIATSTDTSAIDVQVFAYDGSTAFLIGTITVPIGAGNTGTVGGVNLLQLAGIPGLNSDGSITLPTSWKLQASNVTTVTAAKTLTVVCVGGDY